MNQYGNLTAEETRKAFIDLSKHIQETIKAFNELERNAKPVSKTKKKEHNHKDKRRRSILVIDTTTNNKQLFNSIQQAANVYRIDRTTVYRYLNGHSKHKYLLFQYD